MPSSGFTTLSNLSEFKAISRDCLKAIWNDMSISGYVSLISQVSYPQSWIRPKYLSLSMESMIQCLKYSKVSQKLLCVSSPLGVMVVCKRTRPIVTRFTKLKPFQSCSMSRIRAPMKILVVLSTRRPIGLAFSDSHLLHIFKCFSSFHISILCGFCRNQINWSEAEYLNEGPSGIKSS